MNNTKTEIDFEKIMHEYGLKHSAVRNCMKAAVQAAKPIILACAAEKAKSHNTSEDMGVNAWIDKSSILNLVDDEELNAKLGLI